MHDSIGEGIDFDGLNETLLLMKQCFLVNITILDDIIFEANETSSQGRQVLSGSYRFFEVLNGSRRFLVVPTGS